MSRTPKKPVLAPKMPARWFSQSRVAMSYALSADGKLAAHVQTLSGGPDLYITRVEESAWPHRITFAHQSIYTLAFSPDGAWIAYETDQGGDENVNLRLVSPDGFHQRRVTDNPKARHQITGWSDEGRVLRYSTNARHPAFFDCFLYHVEEDRHELLFRSDHLNFSTASWGRGRYHLIWRILHNTSQTLSVLDRKTGALSDITPDAGHTNELRGMPSRVKPAPRNSAKSSARTPGEPVVLQAPTYNRFDRRLYLLTDAGADFVSLASMTPSGADFCWVIAPKVDVQSFDLSKDGTVLVWVENHKGRRRVSARNLATGKPLKLDTQGLNAHTPHLAASGRRVMVTLGAGDEPGALNVLDVGGKGRCAPITFPRPLPIRREWLVRPELVEYRGADDWEVSGFFYRPKTEGLKPPYPTICWFHGGPEYQDFDEYHTWEQYLVNRGYALWTCNFRGSTGFGKAFQRGVYRDWGGKCLDDCLIGLDLLIERGLADKKRVAAAGGSYGGYMTLRAITHVPARWRCAIDVFGPANLFTFIESVPPSWRAGTEALIGSLEHDEALLRERSPYFHVDRIRAPLLVIQGANDPRVVQAESDQMVASLRERGMPVEYKVYADEGHGFVKTENAIEVIELMGDFLDRHMRSGQPRRRPAAKAKARRGRS